MTTIRTTRTFRPRMQQLEDRSLPSFGLGWAFNFGSSGNGGKGNDIALDGSGNVYVSGMYSGTVDFDPNDTNPTSNQVLTSTGFYANNFAAKYLADGTFQWVTDLGDNGPGAPGVSVAVQGGTVFAGYPTAVVGGNIAAVARLDAATGAVAWVTPLAATGNVRMNVAVGPAGGVYATGDIAQSQVFVSRLDAAGNLTWTTTSSVSSSTRGIALAVDAAGNAYATGTYSGTLALGTRSLTSWAGSSDAFVWKLDANGATTWAGSLGGNGADLGQGVALDGSGNAFVTGMWAGSRDNNFNPNSGTAVKLTPRGGLNDCFVVKLAPATNGGLTLTWAKNIGGAGDDRGLDIAVDAGGNVYTTGEFGGTANFNPNNGPKRNLTASSPADIFVSKLTSSGNYADAAGFGGTGVDFGRGIVADGSGNVYAIGVFVGTVNFSPNGTYNLTAVGNQDIVVMKLTQGSPLVAVAGPAAGTAPVRLTDGALQPILAAAVDRWAAAGLDPIRLDVLRHASVTIGDLGGSYLGLANPDTHAIRIDDDAAGYGWFVDRTPYDDREFVMPGRQWKENRMDLLSVLAHELGHLVGLDHDDHTDDVMGEWLATGTRRLPTQADVRLALTADAANVDKLAIATGDRRHRPSHRR
jgi:Matrixin